jgi:hypothetical protein
MNPFPSIKAKKLLVILERPALVRKILVKDVGLADDDARKLL